MIRPSRIRVAHDSSSSFSVRPQTIEVKRSTDTSPECHKKNTRTKKNSDIFRLFFGVVVGSAFAPLREMIFRKGAKEDRQSPAKIRGMSMPQKSEFRADSQRAPNPEPQK
jgi:hypothetical protein